MDEPPFALVRLALPASIVAKGGSFFTVSTLVLFSSTSIACGFLVKKKRRRPNASSAIRTNPSPPSAAIWAFPLPAIFPGYSANTPPSAQGNIGKNMRDDRLFRQEWPRATFIERWKGHYTHSLLKVLRHRNCKSPRN